MVEYCQAAEGCDSHEITRVTLDLHLVALFIFLSNKGFSFMLWVIYYLLSNNKRYYYSKVPPHTHRPPFWGTGFGDETFISTIPPEPVHMPPRVGGYLALRYLPLAGERLRGT